MEGKKRAIKIGKAQKIRAKFGLNWGIKYTLIKIRA